MLGFLQIDSIKNPRFNLKSLGLDYNDFVFATTHSILIIAAILLPQAKLNLKTNYFFNKLMLTVANSESGNFLNKFLSGLKPDSIQIL